MAFFLWVAPPGWLISSSRTSGAAAGGSWWTILMDVLHSPTKYASSLPFPLPPFLQWCTFVHSSSVFRHELSGSAASKETLFYCIPELLDQNADKGLSRWLW